jgi:Tat protein translocase TatC
MAQDESEKRMALFDHISELRVRAMRMLYVFMGGFIGGYLVSNPVMEWMRAPLFAALPADKRFLYFTNLFENFMTHLKIAGYLSIFALSPYFFYEIWGFIAPGLKSKERKLVLPFVGAATFFFVGGGLFAYYVLFPIGFKYFIQYGVATDMPMLTIDAYYSTCLKLMLLFGFHQPSRRPRNRRRQNPPGPTSKRDHRNHHCFGDVRPAGRRVYADPHGPARGPFRALDLRRGLVWRETDRDRRGRGETHFRRPDDREVRLLTRRIFKISPIRQNLTDSAKI